jgi:hypothetical protein
VSAEIDLRFVEETMKKILTILAIATILTGCALAQKKEDGSAKAQDTTDWLNAPTPDGSPTLKQTSDWLARAFSDYGGGEMPSGTGSVEDIGIGNDCRFHYTIKFTAHNSDQMIVTDVSFPLGAVTSVEAGSALDGDHSNPSLNFATGSLALVEIAHRGQEEAHPAYRNFTGFPVMRKPEAKVGEEMPQNPEQILPRMVTALQHAVDLCKSAYKPPSQAKQAF